MRRRMATVIPKVTQLSNRVTRVLGCNPGFFTLQGTNTYIVGTGRERALIDCGEPDIPEYLENLKKIVDEQKISLTKIVLTHWHPDHAGGTYQILQDIADKNCKVFKYREPKQDQLFSDLFAITYLKDQDEVCVEGASLQLHHTPGHSKDHLALMLKEENVLFSADCILGEGTVVFEDLITYLQSLQKILALKPSKLYPGHGPVVLEVNDKVNDYIARRLEREAQIVNVLSEAKGEYLSAMDIATKLYSGLSKQLMFGAEYSVRNHLDKLFKEDKLEMIEDETITRFRLKEGSV